MQNTLDEIVANKRKELKRRKATTPCEVLLQQLRPACETFLPALRKEGVRLIGEIKPKSPSAGQLTSNVDPIETAKLYEKQACAISVLTDARYFGGSAKLLKDVSSAVGIPTLCKDFILDPYQIVEARCNGAEAVLLIAKILPFSTLLTLHEAAKTYGMTPVVEVQTEEELETALSVNPQVILINNRNLSTFEIDLATTSRLAPQVPVDTLIISASGIESRQDIQRLLPHTNVFLVGTSLMRAGNVEAKLRELTGLIEGETACVS